GVDSAQRGFGRLALPAHGLPSDGGVGAAADGGGLFLDALLAGEPGLAAAYWRYVPGGGWLWAGGGSAGDFYAERGRRGARRDGFGGGDFGAHDRYDSWP